MITYVVIRQKFYRTEEHGLAKHTEIAKSGGYGKSWRPKDIEQEYYDRIELWIETNTKCRRIRIFKSTLLKIDNNYTLYL